MKSCLYKHLLIEIVLKSDYKVRGGGTGGSWRMEGRGRAQEIGEEEVGGRIINVAGDGEN